MLRMLFELVYRVIPKRNHALLYGWPDGEDHTRALLPALQETPLKSIILLAGDPESIRAWARGPHTRCVRKNSPAGLWAFLRAKYVFFSHPCFVRRFPLSVTAVNLWHGAPIKKIGVMIENDPPIACSHTLASSAYWGDIMRRTITRPGGRMLDTGLPRNDRLFADASLVFENLGVDPTTRLVVWLPTYRSSARGLPRQDGLDYGNAFAMPDIDPQQLNDVLAARDVLLLVKPHPMAPQVADPGLSHLKIIDNEYLHQCGLSLYQLLGASALLITDVSSVLIDYLLLDRPVIHAFADLETYRASRGFTIEPVEEWFAGSVVGCQQTLLAALEGELAGEDPHARQRRRLRDLSHTHPDGGATERLLREIGLRV